MIGMGHIHSAAESNDRIGFPLLFLYDGHARVLW